MPLIIVGIMKEADFGHMLKSRFAAGWLNEMHCLVNARLMIIK
jgi:hypothetical protein